MSGILVGIDGSEHARRALEWAMREAILRNAPLTVITVHQLAMDHWGLGPLRYPQDESARQAAEAAARQAVEKVTADLSGKLPPSVTVRAANGIPAEVLIGYSEDADLLVVGAHGHGLEHAIGSVSHKVARHAACPVAIVR